ncbi:MAG: MgtC/SapB family protein [Proteobacteria bacterium]|nr:MgtC/SapB family protein [Pseudomonadota bacterium]
MKPTETQLLTLTVGLGAGLLIGIERERRKGHGAHRKLAGVRTFALSGVAGALCALIPHAWLTPVGGLLILALVAIRYWRDRSHDPGITTSVALFVTFAIGVLAATLPAVAAAIAVMVTALLMSREPLHRFANRLLTASELRDALIFCGAALIVFPLLPNRDLAWLPAVNAQRFLGLVIIFMALQALGYVALRVSRARLGLALSGLASGFISSTATIAALGSRARKAPDQVNACVAGALFSSVATLIFLAIVIATVNPEAFRIVGVSIVCGLAAAGISAAVGFTSAASSQGAPKGRPFSLINALIFAALLTTATAGMSYITDRFGNLGLAIGAALTGFVDVHAATTSVLSVAKLQPTSGHEVLIAVLCAFSTNTISKIIAGFSSGGLRYGGFVALGHVAIAMATWAPLLWLA